MDLASKHLAVVRGLGYDGVYLGGHMPAETFREIIDRADALGGEDWREFAREIQFPLPGEFHFFEPDPETGLSSDVVNRAYLESKRRRRTDLRVPAKYRLSRRLHDTVFARDGELVPLTLVKTGAVASGDKVLSAETARAVRAMLEPRSRSMIWSPVSPASMYPSK